MDKVLKRSAKTSKKLNAINEKNKDKIKAISDKLKKDIEDDIANMEELK